MKGERRVDAGLEVRGKYYLIKQFKTNKMKTIFYYNNYE